MINSTQISGSVITTPQRVFTASTTGAPVGTGGAAAQTRAVTTIIICNTGVPDPTDETVNSCNINISLIPAAPPTGFGNSAATTLIVSNLTVPAGETVFFSEERLVLDGGDAIWVGGSALATTPTPGAPLITVTVSSLPV